MAFRISYSRRSLRRLYEIEVYLTERNPSGSRKVLREIRHSIDLLECFPFIGTEIEALDLRYHVTLRYRYRIIYRISGETIEIRNILHRRQREDR